MRTTLVNELVKDLPRSGEGKAKNGVVSCSSAFPQGRQRMAPSTYQCTCRQGQSPAQSLRSAMTAAALSMNSDFPRWRWPGDGSWEGKSSFESAWLWWWSAASALSLILFPSVSRSSASSKSIGRSCPYNKLSVYLNSWINKIYFKPSQH